MTENSQIILKLNMAGMWILFGLDHILHLDTLFYKAFIGPLCNGKMASSQDSNKVRIVLPSLQC